MKIVTDMANEKTDSYTQLSSLIQEKLLANPETPKIYDQKDSWRVEMEMITRPRFLPELSPCFRIPQSCTMYHS